MDFTITAPDKWLAKREWFQAATGLIGIILNPTIKNGLKKDSGLLRTSVRFDVTHSWTVGTERFLMALVEDPDWCVDMFNHYLDMNIALFDMVREKAIVLTV